MALEKNVLLMIGGGALAVVGGALVVFSGKPAATTPEAAPTEMASAAPSAAPSTAPGAVPNASPAPTETATDSQTVSTASAPTDIVVTDKALEYKIAMPPGAANDPVLAPILKDAKTAMDKLRREATAESKQPGFRTPWEGVESWEYAAKAGGVVSLIGQRYTFTGGAHGNTIFDAVIARSSGEKLKLDDMFKLDKSPSPALAIGVCEAIKAAKREKNSPMEINDAPIVCAGPKANPELSQVTYALAPSSTPGKFGGVYAIFQTYTLGPYVDGAYIVPVQQGVFAEDLKPEFKPLFGGEAPEWQP